MKINLPNSAFIGNIDSFLRSYSPENPEVFEVSLNEKWNSLHPLVLAMTAILGLKTSEKGGRIVCGKPVAKSRNYLARMELFKFLGVTPDFSFQTHEASGRFIPLTNIRTPADLTRFIEDLVPLLHSEPDQAAPIKYTISELVRNVLEHAQTPLGAMVCAQFFKKTNRVSIGVADVGVGIKQTMSASYDVKTDGEAIKLALQPGITGTTPAAGGTESNAGAGLFFIKSIAKVNREFFVLYSGTAAYKLLKSHPNQKISLFADPQRDRHSLNETFPYWRGTAVGVDIALNENKRFEELLAQIRQVYRLDLQDKRKLKRARFA